MPERRPGKRLPHHMGGSRRKFREKPPDQAPAEFAQPIGIERLARDNRFKSRFIIGFGATTLAFFASQYNLHHTEILSSYGKDFLMPLGAWYGFPQIAGRAFPRLEKFAQSKIPLILYSTYAAGFEAVQYYLLEVAKIQTPDNRYDLWDFAALGAGVTLALGVDKFVRGRERRLGIASR
ncbi:hypothetical protein HYS97_03150 [Candidatus Daviesbacteria bacterium]|nr:hypothetical protein [Candidatus Daviesbacteria bacterium]